MQEKKVGYERPAQSVFRHLRTQEILRGGLRQQLACQEGAVSDLENSPFPVIRTFSSAPRPAKRKALNRA